MQTFTTLAGHTFTFEGVEPYTRKDGTGTHLDVWSTPCRHPGCKTRFVVRIPQGTSPQKSTVFGLAHCTEHRLTRPQATKKWLAACSATNTKATPEVLSSIKQLYQEGLSPRDIALIVPLSFVRIYTLIKKHNFKKQT